MWCNESYTKGVSLMLDNTKIATKMTTVHDIPHLTMSTNGDVTGMVVSNPI